MVVGFMMGKDLENASPVCHQAGLVQRGLAISQHDVAVPQVAEHDFAARAAGGCALAAQQLLGESFSPLHST